MTELETCRLADIPRDLLLLAEPDARAISRYPHDSRVFAARVGGQLAAVAVLVYRFARRSEIVNIAVYPEFRGRNIGRILLEACLQSARDLNHHKLIIRTSTTSILQLGLYQRFGFRVVGVDRTWFARHYSRALQENMIIVRDRLRLELNLVSERAAAADCATWLERLVRIFELDEDPFVWRPRYGAYVANAEIAGIEAGEKTAICLPLDLADAGRVPEPGNHIVFADGLGRPCCTAVVTKTSISAFDSVPIAHAIAEGFSNDPLAEWQAWYRSFLPRKFEVLGLDFRQDSRLLLIEFTVLETRASRF